MGIYYPFLGGGRTCNQITTPLVYDESLSVEQQIACLFGKIANIDSDFVTTVEFDDFKSQIHAEQVAQTEQLEGYTDSEIAKLDKELRDLIAGSQVGLLIWNVTVGRYTGNVRAMRDFFNDVTVHAITVAGGSENGQHMLECGAAYAPLILEQGQWYRMFSSMFLHFGAPHLINNMLVLFVLGQRLEPVTGKIKFFLIYIFGGLGGNMLSLFFDMYAGNASLSAGASGAVFAVMGGMIYVIIRHRGRVADLTVRQMLIMAAFSLYFGFASEGVDNVAHIGGLLSGFLIAVILYHPRKIWKTVP